MTDDTALFEVRSDPDNTVHGDPLSVHCQSPHLLLLFLDVAYEFNQWSYVYASLAWRRDRYSRAKLWLVVIQVVMRQQQFDYAHAHARPLGSFGT